MTEPTYEEAVAAAKKKHYVVLEFDPEQEGDVSGIPWHDLLRGAVVVSNHKLITRSDLEAFAMVAGLGQVTSDTNGFTTAEVLKQLKLEAQGGPERSNDIIIQQEFEDENAQTLLMNIHDIGRGIMMEMMDFLGIDRYFVNRELD